TTASLLTLSYLHFYSSGLSLHLHSFPTRRSSDLRALGVTAIGLFSAFLALQTVKGKAFNQFRKDAMVEMRRVVWPTRQETVQTTIIVVIFVLVIAFILFFFDWILNGLISQVIG